MAEDIIGGVRQLISDFVAPDLRAIAGQLEAIEARIVAVDKTLWSRMDALEEIMKTRFDAIDLKLDLLLKYQSFDARIGRIEAELVKETRLQEKSLKDPTGTGKK